MALIHCHFKSSVLNLHTSIEVILPIGWPENPGDPLKFTKAYQVLWLLHGYSDDQTIWQRLTSIERYADAVGLAVVMPAVEHSFYTDMYAGPKYWTFISEELPAVARALFPLSPAREDNFVAGLSMGGYGAFKLALRCPERFAAAASLSGAVDIVASARRGPRLRVRERRMIFGNLSKLAGSENDLLALAEVVAKSQGPRPRLYQWCGTEDFLYQDNLTFRNHANKLGLDLTYEEGPGSHAWQYWDAQIQRVLEWLPIDKKNR